MRTHERISEICALCKHWRLKQKKRWKANEKEKKRREKNWREENNNFEKLKAAATKVTDTFSFFLCTSYRYIHLIPIYMYGKRMETHPHPLYCRCFFYHYSSLYLIQRLLIQ